MTDKDKKGINTSFDRLPNKEAEKAFDSKTLITSAEFAHFKAYQHALAFTVAGLADKDMLTEIHKAVKSAIDNGTSFNDFKKTLKPFLISKGWLSPELTGDDKADKSLLKEYERVLNRRLKTIYHTNKQTAYAAGKWERIQKTKDFLPYLQYLKSASVNKRDGHKAYYGIVRPVDDPIWQSIFPPNGFGCFLGDVQIQGDLQSAMVKWYEGVAVHFTTKSGRSLAVTANHPILTARGWVRADGLTTSDDVLCYGLPVDVVNADGLSGQIHHNQTILTAKNLFKAFFDQTFAFTGTTAFKFNSDVANGEIHIDVINDGLVCHIWADVLQGVKQVKLIRGDDGRFVATGKSNSSSCFATVISDFIGSQNTSDIATTAIKTLCQSTLAYFGCGVQMNNFSFQFVITRTTDRPSLSTLPFNTTSRLFNVLPTSHTGATHISQDDTILTELTSNTCTTDFGLFRYLIDAHSSLVFADPVINIRQFSFSGHCYDFQSSESIVSANGIIAHNCKCSVKQITKSKANKLGITDDETIAKLPTPDFDSNFDRLGSLLRLAEDKHGRAFREQLQKELLDNMLGVFSQTVSASEFTQAMNASLANRRAKALLKKNESIAQKAEKLGLSYEELFAIMGYTDSHGSVQHFLRYFEEFMKSNINYVRITAKQIQYMLQGLQKLPNYVGEVVRRTNDKEHYFRNLQVGDVFTELAFASSSIIGEAKDDTFNNRTIRLIIQSKTGKKIDWLSTHPHQREVVFLPNTRFLVTHTQHIENELWIKMTEIT